MVWALGEMDEYRMAKRMFTAEVSGGLGTG